MTPTPQAHAERLSPFFIRASAGHFPGGMARSVWRLSPFFIRASAGHAEKCAINAIGGSQSLLHQGIGRTHAGSLPGLSHQVSVPSSSGHRPDVEMIRSVHDIPSQSLLHQGIGRTLVSCPRRGGLRLSPFFIRASAGRDKQKISIIAVGLSPFFIRASAGPKGGGRIDVSRFVSVPSSSGHRPDPRAAPRSLPPQVRVSVPSSSGHRPD